MIEIKSRLRKWGNSFGIVVPQKALENSKIKEGEEITVFLRKEDSENVLKEMFGTFKFKRPTEKILKETDKELWNIK